MIYCNKNKRKGDNYEADQNSFVGIKLIACDVLCGVWRQNERADKFKFDDRQRFIK